jgi:integrase
VRVLSLDDAVKAFLSVRWDEQRKYAAKVGVELVADPFILSRHADGAQPCMPDGLSHGFRRVADELGIPYHFHSLRHFAATEAIAAGHNVRAVAQQLGHADPSMTLRVYTHARSEASRAIGKTLGDALGRPAPKALPPAPD